MTTWWRRAGRSVRLRVTLLAAGVFAITLVVASVFLLRALERSLVADIREADEAALNYEVSVVGEEGIPPDATLVDTETGTYAMWQGLGAQPFIVHVVVSDTGDFTVAEGSSQPVPGALAEQLDDTEAAAGVLVSSAPVGTAMLSTFSPLAEVQSTIDTTRRLLWIVGPALVALVAGLAWLLASRALRPVHAMTARVAEIGAGSLHERVPAPGSGDEIAELAETMNAMLGRLERATDTSRRLVSDASHELRTPVAVMRTELEVAQRDAGNDWSATSDVVLGELDRLQDLVDDLLLLARGDERALARTDVDLTAVLERLTARRRQVPVELSGNSHATCEPDLAEKWRENSLIVVGDERALERAFDHLAANAARHATKRVEIAVERNGDTVAVHVDDDGPGIPPDQRDDVVRRFVRLDEGRARDHGGAGLGLAVAADVAAAHGGSLAIGESARGGARVTVELPVADPVTNRAGFRQDP